MGAKKKKKRASFRSFSVSAFRIAPRMLVFASVLAKKNCFARFWGLVGLDLAWPAAALLERNAASISSNLRGSTGRVFPLQRFFTHLSFSFTFTHSVFFFVPLSLPVSFFFPSLGSTFHFFHLTYFFFLRHGSECLCPNFGKQANATSRRKKEKEKHNMGATISKEKNIKPKKKLRRHDKYV